MENDFYILYHCIFSTYLCRYKGMSDTCYLKRNPTDLTFFLIIRKDSDSLLHKNRKEGWGLWVWQPPTYATLTDKFCPSLSWLLWEHSGLDPLLQHESVQGKTAYSAEQIYREPDYGCTMMPCLYVTILKETDVM